MPAPVSMLLSTGLAFPESPRWHDGRLWVADWGAHQVVAIDVTGKSEVVTEVASFPFSIDWLPDGRLLAVSARDRRLLRREPTGALVAHAELGNLSERPWNEIVVDGRGNIYLNNIG
ncbi:MAG TPA: gluconolactonase, partial [Acidimicrobiales bacterium]|nr:gluconolactonase [Acidimicrobiales bacterium]